jgi:very-short-patch-repair endonuclease
MEDKRNMFGDAPSYIFENAKVLRHSMTPAESMLWERLRNNQLMNLRFRRQHPYHSYILDFYCHAVKLCIEIDGSVHQLEAQAEYDKFRSEFLASEGIVVLRFHNEEVYHKIQDVLDIIKRKIEDIISPPRPLPL